MRVTRRRDTPRVMVTDKLCSYGAAKRHVMASVEHRQSKYLNNRAENSHQRTRRHLQPNDQVLTPKAGTTSHQHSRTS